MNYVLLYTGEDGESYFKDVTVPPDSEQPLGKYSKEFPISHMTFREFKPGASYDLHNAPRPQYIVYLSGEVEVITSLGDKRIFKQGDILYATDVAGAGHITRTLTSGRSLIIVAMDSPDGYL